MSANLLDMESTLATEAWSPGAVVNADGRAPVVLVCEHASNAVPPGYGTLGCQPEELMQHIAWDIGAAALAHGLAEALNAPAVLCSTSRLFVDCNRFAFDTGWAPPVSDGISIPVNIGISNIERGRRSALVYEPFHALVASVIEKKRNAAHHPVLIAIHTFAATMNGVNRPPVAVIWDTEQPAQRVIEALRSEIAGVGDNEPYDGRRQQGYTFARHARPYGLPRFAIEVRQDLLGSPSAIDRWVGILTKAFSTVLPGSGQTTRGPKKP